MVSSNVIAAAYIRNREYAKSLEFLSRLNGPDTISWKILASMCARKGYHIEAFEVFKHMLEVQIYPAIGVLRGCSSLQCLSFGSSIHGHLLNPISNDVKHLSALIDMYAKCGCVEDSVKVFQDTQAKNLFTWTTIISALGHYGLAFHALEKFKEIECVGIKPDAVSFVAAFLASRHGGLVEEGMELLLRMQRLYRLVPEMDHYHGLVDLLA